MGHIAASVAWLGGAAVLLMLGLSVLTGAADPDATYAAASLVGSTLVAPLSLTALVTGLISALGTRWGVFRHWWVTVKLATTALMAVLVQVLLLPGLQEAAAAGAELPEASRVDAIIGPSVSCVLLTLNVVLSVYKPGRARSARSRVNSSVPSLQSITAGQ